MSKQTRKFDLMIADELGLELADIAIILKHATRFPEAVTQFVFAYEQSGLSYYDVADTWTEVNGMRVRNPRFRSHPIIEDRLNRRQYYRWYVVGNGRLFPVQTAKVETLRDLFSFVTDSDPSYRTQTVLVGETQFIRKKPITQCRQTKPTWEGAINVSQKTTTVASLH